MGKKIILMIKYTFNVSTNINIHLRYTHIFQLQVHLYFLNQE